MSLLNNRHTQQVPARADTRFVAGMAAVDRINVTGLERAPLARQRRGAL